MSRLKRRAMKQGAFVVSVMAIAVFSTAAHGAKPRAFVFEPAGDQTIEYFQGEQVALKDGQYASVAMRFIPAIADNKHAWVEVTIENRASQSILVAETSLAATGAGESLKVYTYDELARAEKRAQMWNAVAAGLGAAGNSMAAANAGYSSTTGTYQQNTSARAYGSNGAYAYGNATTNGVYSGTTYNAGEALAAQNAANDRNRQLMADMEAANQQNRNSLETRALRINTLRPEGAITGQIMVDLPRKARNGAAALGLVLTVGEEQFLFSLVEVSAAR